MKTFDEALHYLLTKAKQTEKTETISISDALGRVLAKPIVSTVNVPPHDNSMMDGYAIHSFDLEHNSVFTVSQRIPAGSTPQALKTGTATRIFTGAPIPEGANMVIMQEESEPLSETEIKITAEKTNVGQNIRVIGEDIAENATILKAGHKLRPQDLGLITSIGIDQVVVFKPLTIATFTTGDE
ncbi:MAG TPA: molybdopterin molybdenumtransferase MoeA, partial [Thiomicrospira sp.]|nr:molybdopterin molybdenumtransferase MoeA [Thiomicrospira sp.]